MEIIDVGRKTMFALVLAALWALGGNPISDMLGRSNDGVRGESLALCARGDQDGDRMLPNVKDVGVERGGDTQRVVTLGRRPWESERSPRHISISGRAGHLPNHSESVSIQT